MLRELDLADNGITDWGVFNIGSENRVFQKQSRLRILGMPIQAKAGEMVARAQARAEPYLDGFAFVTDFLQLLSFPFTINTPWDEGSSSEGNSNYFGFLRGMQLDIHVGFAVRFWVVLVLVCLVLLALAPISRKPRRALVQMLAVENHGYPKVVLLVFSLLCKFGSTSLFLPLFRTLLSALDCTAGPDRATLDVQPDVQCWTVHTHTTHNTQQTTQHTTNHTTHNAHTTEQSPDHGFGHPCSFAHAMSAFLSAVIRG
jgi:hypothetical protein